MSHLDEGTIHAWLDDALSPDEAARVEAHARECAECAAMVAEARGFIAGASRIVGSLDVVRGNAIPVTTASAQTTAPRGSLWKTLKLTPARAAIAATLLVGVASMFTFRHQDVDLGAPAAEKIAVSPLAAPSVGTTTPTPAAAAAPVPATAPTRVAAAQKPAEDRAATKRDEIARASVAEEPKARIASADTVAANNNAPAAPAPAAAERKVASAASLNPVVPPTASAPTARLRSTATDTSPRLTEVTVTGVMSGVARGATMSDAGAASSIPRGFASESPQAVAAGEAKTAGCYSVRLDRAVDLRGFPSQLMLARDSIGRKSVHAIAAGRDSVLDGAVWLVRTGGHVLVGGSDAQFGSVSIQFAIDSTRAVVRAVTGTTDATITRMACPR